MTRPDPVGFVSKFLFKLHLYLQQRFDPRQPATREEVLCTQICLTLIDQPDCKLMMGPLSQKRFIKHEDKGIFVIINHRHVSVINHIYGYNLLLEDDQLFKELIEKFDHELERRRQALEDEMRAHIQDSLNTILDRAQGRG